MVIGGYSIDDYWWLFYCWVIGSYFIHDYQWLFYCRLLLVILLVVIDDYSIGDYFIISYWC